MGEAPPLSAGPGGGSTLTPSTAASLVSLPYKEARSALLHDFDRRYLTDLLGRTNGNVARAAREAKMDRLHLTELLQRHWLR
jgi:DNA-binding NtrC family response regulator